MSWPLRASIERTGDMVPVTLVARSSIDVWLKRTTSMVVLGEK
jgi:hypothetical protein